MKPSDEGYLQVPSMTKGERREVKVEGNENQTSRNDLDYVRHEI